MEAGPNPEVSPSCEAGPAAERSCVCGLAVVPAAVGSPSAMDYLTAFTGKGGRLLRGTASRLWAAVPGGFRQVRFQDSVGYAVPQPAEPAPGTGGDGAGGGRTGRGAEPCAPPGRAASLLPPCGGADPERGLSGVEWGSVPVRERRREE